MIHNVGSLPPYTALSNQTASAVAAYLAGRPLVGAPRFLAYYLLAVSWRRSQGLKLISPF